MVIIRICKKEKGALITHKDASVIVTTMLNAYLEVEAVDIEEAHVTLLLDDETLCSAIAEFRRLITTGELTYTFFLELNH
jgi:hypothetical protein